MGVVVAGLVAAVGLTLGASSGGASITWSSGFEQTWSPWQGLQYGTSKPLSDSFHYVTSPVRTGKYAAEFVVRDGYGEFGNERTELCCGPSGEGQAGTDQYWAWSTYFPTSWVEPYKWGLFFQLHAGDDMPPAIALDAGGDAAWLEVRSGLVDPSTTSWSYGAFPQVLTTLSKGHWNDFVLHVKWATGNTGVVQLWHRVAGTASFTLVADLESIPTLQHYADGSIGQIYTKLGLYRASYCDVVTPGCQSSLGTQPTDVLYDDSFVRGSSFADVVAAAWGGGTAPPPTTTPAPSSGTFGTTSVGSSSDAGGANYLDASGPYPVGTKVSVSKLTGYITGESKGMSVRGVIYADNGGQPGSLVAVTKAVSVAAKRAAGWVQLPLASAVSLPAGGYWLGYWYGAGAGSTGGGFEYTDVSGAEAYAAAAYSAKSKPPSPFPASASASSSYSLYATYKAG